MNGSPAKGAATVPAVDEEDELPPRMDSAHASPRVAPVPLPRSGKNTPTSSRPSTPSNDPAPHLPIHAGFDLNAIKNALQEVEQNPNKSFPAPSSSTSPPPPPKSLTKLAPLPIAPPSNRSQSTPPVQVVGADAHPRASSFDYGYGASQSPSEDKVPAGMGLGSSRADATFAGPSSPFSRSYSASSRLAENDISSNSYASSFARTTPMTTNSFSSDFDDAYATHTPRPTTNTLGLPDDIVPSWGAPTSSFSSSFAFSSSATSKSSMINPFANPSSSPLHGLGFPESPGLSFGSADGAIVAPSGGQNDAWGIPPLGMASKKRSAVDGFNSNPWS